MRWMCKINRTSPDLLGHVKNVSVLVKPRDGFQMSLGICSVEVAAG
jgi:hypothetical protein